MAPPTIMREIARVSTRERALIAARQGTESSMNQQGDKLAALLDTVRVLDDANIAYALIGGVAVGIHSGIPRATLDVDFAVLSTSDQALIASVFRQAGFRLVGTHPHSTNFRHAGGEPVQLAFDPAFDSMIERADVLTMMAVSVRVVGRSDLIAMKERAAADPARRRSKRLRDEADVALLKGDVPDPDEGW